MVIIEDKVCEIQGKLILVPGVTVDRDKNGCSLIPPWDFVQAL